MNWEAVGAIGEVVGAAGVVATLVYLARQIGQNSDALDRSSQHARASSIQQANAQFGGVFSLLAQDAELASIYERALSGESLEETETVRFQAFVNTFCAWFENMHTQTSLELAFTGIEEGDATTLMAAVGPYLGRLLATEAGRQWWERDAPHLYTSGFIASVNGELVGAETGPPSA